MRDFARLTGLEPAGHPPKRYLWTDAFAVCNFLGLFGLEGDRRYLDLALSLVDQVHRTLGRHRADDTKSGWISGLDEEEGARHPTRGGLRIGKPLNERRPGEPVNERLEWDRDGQYYHYLTKWMHALSRVSRATNDPAYLGWAIELAKTAQARFTYAPSGGGPKRMFWKMSVDLSRPLVSSMGQHDPLDGLVTYSELQAAASDLGGSSLPGLNDEIADMAGILRGAGLDLATDDPLGIGGLLSDAWRLGQLALPDGQSRGRLLENILDWALQGTQAWSMTFAPDEPAERRLAFRELGLSIGLSAVESLGEAVEAGASLPGPSPPADRVSPEVSALPGRDRAVLDEPRESESLDLGRASRDQHGHARHELGARWVPVDLIE